MLAYYSIATNMALFLEQNDIGGPALAGTIISFTTVGGMITSLLLAWLETKFKNQLIPIMLLGMGIAFTLLSFTNNIALVVVSVCLIGFGQGILFPLIILKVLNQVEFQQGDRAIAITSSFIFMGQFLSPIVLDGVGQLFNNQTIRFQYTILAIVILLAVFLNILNRFYQNNQLITGQQTNQKDKLG